MEGKILDVLWFTNWNGTVGIVTHRNQFNEVRAFISSIPFTTNEKNDALYIAEYGNTFPLDAAISLGMFVG